MKQRTMKATAIQEAMLAAKNNKEVSVLDVVKTDKDTSAIVTKMVEDRRNPERYDSEKNLVINAPSRQGLFDRADGIVSRIEVAENLKAMLPDIELISQILVSSILAPKDFLTTELHQDIDPSILNARLYGIVKTHIEEFFDSTYKIKDRLYDYVEDILFNTGSKPLLVLPENVIDDLINKKSNFSMESLSSVITPNGEVRSKRILGPGLYQRDGQPVKGTDISLESFMRGRKNYAQFDKQIYHAPQSGKDNRSLGMFVEVEDNIDLLKLDKVSDLITRHRIESVYTPKFKSDSENGVSTESHGIEFNLSDSDIANLLYKHRNNSNDTVRVAKTQSQLHRRSVTEPLVMELPSESFIPVTVPGNVDKIVGGFLLLDENGNPITRSTMNQLTMNQLSSYNDTPFAQGLISRTKFQSKGPFNCGDKQHFNEMANVYSSIVIADLLARLRNGVYGRTLRLANNQEIYRIMLARALAGNYTKMLWIPKELITYLAVDRDSDGIGVSMLVRNQVLGAMRSALLFADMRAAIRNSVGITNIEITLDENDPNPEKSIELAKGIAISNRQATVPYQVGSPMEMEDLVGMAGYNFSFTGNDKIPNITVQKSEGNSNYSRPDSEMMEYLAKVWAMGFSITPELLDNVYRSELATVAFQNHALLTKRVVQLQSLLNPGITDHCQIVARHHEGFVSTLRGILEEHFEDINLPNQLREHATKSNAVKADIITFTIDSIIDSLTTELARPELASTESKLNELENFETMLDKKLDNYFNEESYPSDVYGELTNQLTLAKAVIKSTLMRQEMDKMNLGGDITDLFSTENDRLRLEQILESHSSLGKTIITAMADFINEAQDFKDASDKASEALDLDEGSSGGVDSGSGDDSDDGMGGGDDDMFGDLADDPSEESEDSGDEETDLGEDEPMRF